ncbi:glycosyltransferase family 2 protein [Streptomyces barkulensis]|uniref:glycosyltransferase family 2 protein n=1 Tax=Streptomyces barkulensis TaxID=1257026 RepID=UPI000C6E91B1|nr:glycosyltransferase family 2 protein [Streptomyces barkulensis]
MSVPDVTVIIGAYNAMPYLTRCVTSAVEQTIGHHRMEIIAVDDGSTDGSGEELDRLAAEHGTVLEVIHQENSGGPAGPRNVGLDHAGGRYVFFLDADDYLGPEALERMVAAADANSSDVVLGRMVGVGGRRAPTAMFKRSEDRTDVFSSRVYWTLNPMKLFRRDLVERLGLRFRTELKVGQDQPFTATAYLNAAAISVVADYDCVYWVAREDGGNNTAVVRGTEMRLRFLSAMLELVGEHVAPGPDRDHLLHRHFSADLRETLNHLAREAHREDQQKAFARLRELLATWYGDGVARRLSAIARLRCHLIEHGMLDELLELLRYERARGAVSYGLKAASGEAAEPLTTLVEGDRVYARYPYFRDPAAAVPDHVYDVTDDVRARHRVDSVTVKDGVLRITGHAHLRKLSCRELETELVLRSRSEEAEYRTAVTSVPAPELAELGEADDFGYPLSGFEAEVDLAGAADGEPLGNGIWDVALRLRAQGMTRTTRIGGTRAPSVREKPLTRVIRTGPAKASALTVYFSRGRGHLALDVGENKHRVLRHLSVTDLAWSPSSAAELRVGVRCTVAGLPADALSVCLTGSDGTAHRFPAVRDHGSGRHAFLARVDLAAAHGAGLTAAGAWSVDVHLDVADLSWRLPLTPAGGLGPARWRRRALTWCAEPAPGEALVLNIRKEGLFRRVGSDDAGRVSPVNQG